MRACVLIVVALTAGACAESAPPPNPGGTDAGVEVSVPQLPEGRPLSELFEAPGPRLVGPLKGTALGEPLVVADKRSPELFGPFGHKTREWGGDWRGTRFIAGADRGGRVGWAEVRFSVGGALEALTEAWGSPKKAPSFVLSALADDGHIRPVMASYWFDEARGVRAAYAEAPTVTGRERVLRIDRYLPLDRFFGKKGEPFGWETLRLLGSSQSALAQAYPGFEVRGKGGGQIHLPPTEWVDGQTPVFVRFRGGRAVQIAIEIDTRIKPETRQRVFDLLTAKYGPPKGRPPSREEKRWILREGDVPVLLTERGTRIKLIVGRL